MPAEAIRERLDRLGLVQVLLNTPPGNAAAGERGLAALPGREADFQAALQQALHYARTLACPRIHVMAGVQPVGATRPRKVNVRIVCATNQDPLEAVRRGAFREDLYYRLNVFPISVPPLRSRRPPLPPPPPRHRARDTPCRHRDPRHSRARRAILPARCERHVW